MVKGKDGCEMMKDERKPVRVMEEKDVRLYGEYRTSRLVLGRGMVKVKDELLVTHIGEYQARCLVLAAWDETLYKSS
jgi:hypothetical protein